MSNDLIIEQFFPIHVGYAFNPFHGEIEEELINHCTNLKRTVRKGGNSWISNKTYNTCDTHNILNDKKFERLNNWIHQNVNQFTNELSFNMQLKCYEGWFNIYEKYDYQEFHKHNPYIISCTYFLKSEENASKIFLKNDRELLLYSNDLSSDTHYSPHPGKLLIFSSYVDHAVERNEADNTRITLAYNYGK